MTLLIIVFITMISIINFIYKGLKGIKDGGGIVALLGFASFMVVYLIEALLYQVVTGNKLWTENIISFSVAWGIIGFIITLLVYGFVFVLYYSNLDSLLRKITGYSLIGEVDISSPEVGRVVGIIGTFLTLWFIGEKLGTLSISAISNNFITLIIFIVKLVIGIIIFIVGFYIGASTLRKLKIKGMKNELASIYKDYIYNTQQRVEFVDNILRSDYTTVEDIKKAKRLIS